MSLLDKLLDKAESGVTGSGGLLDRLVDSVNNAAKKIDLSGIKSPTIKTDNTFSFKNPIVIVGIAVLAWLFFKRPSR